MVRLTDMVATPVVIKAMLSSRNSLMAGAGVFHFAQGQRLAGNYLLVVHRRLVKLTINCNFLVASRMCAKSQS